MPLPKLRTSVFKTPRLTALRSTPLYFDRASSTDSKPSFSRTGEKPTSPFSSGSTLNPNDLSPRSDEYSKSGGDDAVTEQDHASFKQSSDTDPASQKERAGRGNKVNPLAVSPADPELSKVVEEKLAEKGMDRDVSVRKSPKKGKVVVDLRTGVRDRDDKVRGR